MNTFPQSKLQRLKASIGWRRKTAIVLPLETLIHILHHFPRKQLVKRYSRVNSTFFQTTNQLLPNLHIIHEDNIKFLWPNLNRGGDWADPFVKFEGAILRKSKRKYGKIIRLMDRITESPSVAYNGVFYGEIRQNRKYGIIGKFMGRIMEKRMTAEDFLTNTPPWFVQFPNFAVFSLTDYETRIHPFLRATQQNFVNSRVYLSVRHGWEYAKLPELLADTFLDAGEILIREDYVNVFITRPGYAVTLEDFRNIPFEALLETNAVTNCDKVRMDFNCDISDFNREQSRLKRTKCLCSRQTTESAIKWLESKQHVPGSRRHLTLWEYSRCEELLEMLIQEFKVATKPVNYVLSSSPIAKERFVRYRGLDLENELTGERLTLIRKKVSFFRLWRRIVTPSDSAWMSALAENKISANTIEGFDAKFYKCEKDMYALLDNDNMFDRLEYDASGYMVCRLDC